MGFVVAFTVLAAANALSASAIAKQQRLADAVATSTPIGAVTKVPYGWADLCGRQPQECLVNVLQPTDLRLSNQAAQILQDVNAKVNSQIVSVSNFAHWHTMLDHWDYPKDGKGDCKIFALWKRKQLLDKGFPRQALLMTIVTDRHGNGHAILTVKTDRGDFVLDNLVGRIRPWDDTGYTFIKRQSQYDPNVWISLNNAKGVHDPSRKVFITAGSNLDEPRNSADPPLRLQPVKERVSSDLSVNSESSGTSMPDAVKGDFVGLPGDCDHIVHCVR